MTGTVPVNNSLLTGTRSLSIISYWQGPKFDICCCFFTLKLDCLQKINDRWLHPILDLSLLSPLSLPDSHLHIWNWNVWKTGCDKEAVLSAHITIMEWPLFWSFSVPVTSNKTFLWTNIDALNNFHVKFKTLECHVQLESKLDLFFLR